MPSTMLCLSAAVRDLPCQLALALHAAVHGRLVEVDLVHGVREVLSDEVVLRLASVWLPEAQVEERSRASRDLHPLDRSLEQVGADLRQLQQGGVRGGWAL